MNSMRSSTPKKHKSPKTQMMEDVTLSLDNASLSSPPKDQRVHNNQKKK